MIQLIETQCFLIHSKWTTGGLCLVLCHIWSSPINSVAVADWSPIAHHLCWWRGMAWAISQALVSFSQSIWDLLALPYSLHPFSLVGAQIHSSLSAATWLFSLIHLSPSSITDLFKPLLQLIHFPWFWNHSLLGINKIEQYFTIIYQCLSFVLSPSMLIWCLNPPPLVHTRPINASSWILQRGSQGLLIKHSHHPPFLSLTLFPWCMLGS